MDVRRTVRRNNIEIRAGHNVYSRRGNVYLGTVYVSPRVYAPAQWTVAFREYREDAPRESVAFRTQRDAVRYLTDLDPSKAVVHEPLPYGSCPRMMRLRMIHDISGSANDGHR